MLSPFLTRCCCQFLVCIGFFLFSLLSHILALSAGNRKIYSSLPEVETLRQLGFNARRVSSGMSQISANCGNA